MEFVLENFGDENYRFQIGQNDPDPKNPTKHVDFLRVNKYVFFFNFFNVRTYT